MKMTQEVRDLAARQNTDTFLAASLSPPAGESDSPQASGERGRLGEVEADKGMAEMSERFRKAGSELYVGAGRWERD